MTVSTTDSVVEYVSGGPSFPVPYRFLQDSDIEAVLVKQDGTTETLTGAQYTLSGAGSQNGGTLTSSYAAGFLGVTGASLTISRVMDPVQPTDLRNQGKFLAETHETVFDRLTMLIQQGFAGLSRALVRPIGKNYYDAEGRRIANIADPVEYQDAATKSWAQQYVEGILAAGQGPINNAANIVYVDGDSDSTTVQKGITKQFRDVSRLRLRAGDKNGEQATVLGYYSSTPGVGGGRVYWDASSTEADNDGTVFAVTGVATGRWKRPRKGGVWAEHFGVRNDGDTTYRADNTDRLLKAIQSLRKGSFSITQYIGGGAITAYTSGILNFGEGIFELAFDTIDITQDFKLSIVGQGSRGHNQAITAPTTLRFSGTSSGFGIRFFGNGARGGAISHMDVCYADANFTGHLIDGLTSPGFRTHEVRLGCFGGTSGTRVQTAASLVRVTYDEMYLFDRTIFDGCQLAWLSDDTRTLGSNTFGGSVTRFRDCHFYDVAQAALKHSGARTRQGLILDNCGFNPINVAPVNALDLNNVEGLEIIGGHCAPSTGSIPSDQWFKIINCTGDIKGAEWSTSKPGTFNGMLTITGCRISCDNGLVLDGGVITAHSNEFSAGTQGYIVTPSIPLAIVLGPDLFKAAITTSYYVPADSTLLSGRINYNFNNDSSTSKLFNKSSRITFRNLDEQIATITALPANGSALFSGRTYSITALSGTFTLPVPVLGCKIRVMKPNATALTIVANSNPSPTNFLTGATGARTSAVATSGELGAELEFEAYSETTWLCTVVRGTWAFT
ncbi:hypothetical protein V1687_18070 [Pseudomonas putida]|uniref:hypothetical protein n=1 Tax=Pseudomonas putida TaxID=303 RepID=UPI002ECFBE44|nr:hypothetical protein V1687_18070 [Pseudomonas putida]